jgi:hypothetical protein
LPVLCRSLLIRIAAEHQEQNGRQQAGGQLRP